MNYLVDTNVLSELRKSSRADPGVRAWFREVADECLFTSVLVLGEIRRGIEGIRRRDPVQAAALEQWLARLGEAYGDRVLEVDRDVADAWGHLGVPDPVPVLDGLLAATALAHGMTLVTRNVRDFEGTGVRVLNPFSG